ncbi:MAG TPA: 3-hydroxyacyl-CoA dehydrogenase [Casimicrobiaceae bacterium]|nr:3-hydroxyacyl-CoA dehydrogenase [Casimicrobiaceae bacterium]
MERTVAVIGAGLIGRAWSMVFARAGWRVRAYDRDAEQLRSAQAFIAASLDEQAKFGLVGDPVAARARIDYVGTVEEAVAGADWVQENLPEMLEAKREAFTLVDRLAPADAVLASSTSAIPASRFTETLPGRARCLVAHPVNPPHLVPVVEICGAPWTSPSVIERAQRVYADVGQVPIVVRREIDGFILNRLQGALLAEALRLVGEGFVSPQDLDKTVCDGLGLRWSFMGPLATIELNAPGGVADYCARYGGFYRRLASAPPAPDVWDAANAAKVAAALALPASAPEIDARMRWRDLRLMALATHKREQSQRDSGATKRRTTS